MAAGRKPVRGNSQADFDIEVVRKERLELSRVAPLEPKSSASTSSATLATVFLRSLGACARALSYQGLYKTKYVFITESEFGAKGKLPIISVDCVLGRLERLPIERVQGQVADNLAGLRPAGARSAAPSFTNHDEIGINR